VSASLGRTLQRAEERLRKGDVSGAESLCALVLQKSPGNPDALYLLGAAQLADGRARDAVAPLKQAVDTSPRHGAALEHLGLAYLMLGKFAEAEGVLSSAAVLPGAPASVLMRLGIAMLEQGRPEESLAALRRALTLDPQNVDCHLNLGRALAHVGNVTGAREHIEAVLRLSPRHADAAFNMGVIAFQREQLAEARQWFERALALSPRYVDAMVGLGLVLQKQSRLDEAATCLGQALALDPANAAAGNNLAHTLVLQGKLSEARVQYLATLSRTPGLLMAHEGLAALCITLGRLKEAIASLREALRLSGGNARIQTALANTLFQDGQLNEAEAAAQQANQLDPDAAAPYSVLALVHIVRNATDRAIAVLEAGFQRCGDNGLLGMLTHQLQRACDWVKWRAAWSEMAGRLDSAADLGSPFWLLTEATTAEQQLSYTRRWAEAQFGALARQPASRSPAARGSRPRVRVGYLSSDLHEHAIAHLFAGVLEQHDRGQFEIFAYSHGPEDGSATRVRVKQACEHFVDVAWDPDDVVVRRIEDDALDLLVDLKGYTAGARTSILAQRPCQVQINWLGYPGTLGAPFIDYLITDRFIVPPGKEAAYSERILYLSSCWQCNDRSRPLIEPLTRKEYGLPDDAFVFCCFNQPSKITPEIFACWTSLLRRIAHGVLWLAQDNPLATHNLSTAAREQGIAPERLVFGARLPYAQHLARYCVADLALDTLPYTSHTTLSDALWCGCPAVGLCGETFAARVSGSILTAAALPDLVTYTLADYEALARRLAADPAALTEVRLRVARAKNDSPLFDSTGFTRSLEHLYAGLAHGAGDQASHG
jgi:protein O-GlcNAc transferase